MPAKYSHAKTHPRPVSEEAQRPVYPLKDRTTSEFEAFTNVKFPANTAIGIDFGRHHLRAGPTSLDRPVLDCPTLCSRYKDKVSGSSGYLVGNDVFHESSVKTGIKSPFDASMINNWDMVERILDYTFLRLNVQGNSAGNGSLSNPIILTEQPFNPLSQRLSWEELMFETYGVPKMTFGVDSLFSFKANGGKDGLVVGTGNDSSHIIPVIDGKPILNVMKRINVGGNQLNEYMRWFLSLKYPYFPQRLNEWQVENLIYDHCYVSNDFNEEIKHSLDLDYLEENDVTLEAPFTEIVVVEKTEAEKKQVEERRRENARRMQKMAKEKRKEKLEIKQQDYDYYVKLKEEMESMSKKEVIDTLREAGFDDQDDMDEYISALEKALKKANLIENDDDDEAADAASKYDFSILDRPNEELTPEELKEKRKLRLIKSNIDSKKKARELKEEALKEAEEAKNREARFRETDLEGWIKVKRDQLEEVIQKRKERQKLKEELSDRKSKASQQRMKNIASLADDGSGTLGNQLRKRNHGTTIDKDPTDNFGANDDDWAIYNDISQADDEAISDDEKEQIYNLEVQLLAHDPNFNIEHTQERQFDWKGSTLHKFMRGPREFDGEDQHQVHQIHLNVERIKIPEILFQPNMAGVDQAGISEVCEDLLLRRLPQERGFSGDSESWLSNNEGQKVLSNIFLTGGLANFNGFQERLQNDLRQVLPTDTDFKVNVAKDPLRDSWKGLRSFSMEAEDKDWITKKQYEEMGGDYIAENNYCCVQNIVYDS